MIPTDPEVLPELAGLLNEHCKDVWASVPSLPPLESTIAAFFRVLFAPTDDADLGGVPDEGVYLLRSCLKFEGERGERAASVEKFAAWMEAFLRKLLAVWQPQKLEEIARKRQGLAGVLRGVGAGALNLEANPDREERISEIDRAVLRAYRVRNANHVARAWTPARLLAASESIALVCLSAVARALPDLARADLATRREPMLPRLRELRAKCLGALRGAIDLDAHEELTTDALAGIDAFATEDVLDIALAGDGLEWGTHPEYDSVDDQLDALDDNDATVDASEAGGETRDTRHSKPRVAQRRRISAVIDEISRVILLGPPGAGKTTTLLRLVGQMVEPCLRGEPAVVPLLVELRRVSEDRPLALLVAEALCVAPQLVTEALGAGDVCLFLDGFNEAPSALHDALVRDIAWLASRPGTRIVLTSRDLPILARLRLPRWRMEPLSDPQIGDLLERLFASRERARTLCAALAAERRMTEWARNPMMLRMLGEIFKAAGGELPSNRGRVLQRCVETMYVREARKPTVQTRRDLKDRVLAEVAWYTRSCGRREFSYDDFVVGARVALADLATSLDLGEFCAEVCANRFTRKVGNERYAFDHELYQEYFAAVALCRRFRSDPAILGRLALDPDWLEPLTVAYGLVEDKVAFVQTLAPASLSVAAACVMGDAQASPQLRLELAVAALEMIARRRVTGSTEGLAVLVRLRAWSALVAALAFLIVHQPPWELAAAESRWFRALTDAPDWSDGCAEVLRILLQSERAADEPVVRFLLSVARHVGPPSRAETRSLMRHSALLKSADLSDPVASEVFVLLGVAADDPLSVREQALLLARTLARGSPSEVLAHCRHLGVAPEAEVRTIVERHAQAAMLPEAAAVAREWGLELDYPARRVLELALNGGGTRKPKSMARVIAFAQAHGLVDLLPAGPRLLETAGLVSESASGAILEAQRCAAGGDIEGARRSLPTGRVHGRCKVKTPKPFGFLHLANGLSFHFHQSSCDANIDALAGRWASARLVVVRSRDGRLTIDAVDVRAEAALDLAELSGTVDVR